jgi:hypothetical protein
MSKDGTLRMNLEPELLARIDELIGPVSKSVAVQELGTRVSRHLVSRIALLRGIRLMEQQYSEGTEIVAHEEPKPVPVAKSTPVKEEPTVVAETPDLDVVYDGDGCIKKPDGWDLWTSASVPPGHEEMHDHYLKQGWSRYTGKAGKEVISFYWCSDPGLHDADAYLSADKAGKTILVQDTPYGPGHMIPHGYLGTAA